MGLPAPALSPSPPVTPHLSHPTCHCRKPRDRPQFQLLITDARQPSVLPGSHACFLGPFSFRSLGWQAHTLSSHSPRPSPLPLSMTSLPTLPRKWRHPMKTTCTCARAAAFLLLGAPRLCLAEDTGTLVSGAGSHPRRPAPQRAPHSRPHCHVRPAGPARPQEPRSLSQPDVTSPSNSAAVFFKRSFF